MPILSPDFKRLLTRYLELWNAHDFSMQARTSAYQQALEENPRLMQGASVLDVGCGTGILSMFAARAGASHVTGTSHYLSYLWCTIN